MLDYRKRAVEFLLDDDGPTSVEYAVMLALIIVASFTIVESIGVSVTGIFSDLDTQLN